MSSVIRQIGCVKSATAILGDKWTPQLLRFFASNDAMHFCQLQDLVGGINPRTLSARLISLERQGIIERLAPPLKSRSAYRLTAKGRDLLPILQGMYRWGEKYQMTDTSDVSQ